jgi:hypothetical protein
MTKEYSNVYKAVAMSALVLVLAGETYAAAGSRLPDGTEFPFWEKPFQFTRTYYVDGSAANADDAGPGSKDRPFRTINKAAQVLQPGERVMIAEGVYRECLRPARGGSGPDKMISYEAAPGAKVVVKGSAILKDGWKPSTGWAVAGRGPRREGAAAPKIWEMRLDPKLFAEHGYNPFALVNVLHNRYWLNYGRINMAPYFRRRGIVFVDGKPLEQIELVSEFVGGTGRSLNFFQEAHWEPLFREIPSAGGKLWIEHNGLTLHVRLPNDDDPSQHVIEATVHEQVFVPAERYQSYIRVKGITFQHAGNGFPVPQRGLVSTNRGHHFIFEDNSFEWANSVCLDIGNEDWSASAPETLVGGHVVRGNTFRYCGIEGIGGTGTPNGIQDVLVERNLFEWVGWQDAARMSESAGMKLHHARNLLFRNNVVRHIRYGNGVWLDIANANCRLTGNVFADIPGTVNPHAVHIEGSHVQNQVDNNIFLKIRGGLLIRDTNNVIVAQNLFIDCEDAGVTSTSGLGGPRPVMGHTNDGRGNKVYNNIFHQVGRAAIEFTNDQNESDGNVFSQMPRQGAFLRVLRPEPQQWLDVEFWREQYGWEKRGRMLEMEIAFDLDKLELTAVPRVDLPAVNVFRGIDTDMFGGKTGATRPPGPIVGVGEGYKARKIDPRLTGDRR